MLLSRGKEVMLEDLDNLWVHLVSWQIVVGGKRGRKAIFVSLQCFAKVFICLWTSPFHLEETSSEKMVSKVGQSGKKVPADLFSSGKGRNKRGGNKKVIGTISLRSWKQERVPLFYCNKKYQYFLNLFPNYPSLCVSGWLSATICCRKGSAAVQRCPLITIHGCVTIYKPIIQTGNYSLRKRSSSN